MELTSARSRFRSRIKFIAVALISQGALLGALIQEETNSLVCVEN